MMVRSTLAACLAGGLACAAFAGTATAQTQTFKMTAAVSGGDIYELGAKAFIEQYEFLTDGRIKIQLFPVGLDDFP